MQHRHAALLLVALAALPLGPACGKRGDPLPPLRRRPQPVTDLRLSQRGERLELRFVTPRVTTEGETLPVFEVELLRADQPGELTLLRTRRVAPGESLVESEPLPPTGTTVRYQARARLGREVSVPTPTASLTVQPPPPAPGELRAQLTPRGVRLEWVAPPPPPTPTPTPAPTPAAATARAAGGPVSAEPPAPQPSPQPAPARAGVAPSPDATAGPPPDSTARAGAAPEPAGPTAGAPPSPVPAPAVASPAPTPAVSPTPPPFPGEVWLFRRAEDGSYGEPLARLPLATTFFEDAPPALGATFCYVGRTLYSREPLVESPETPEACLQYRDIAAPGAPLGVAVVVSEGQVEISWSPSPEPDLAGYRVYRARPGQPAEPVGRLPATQTRFSEPIPEEAEVLGYAVTALDTAGNESAPSPSAQVRVR